MNLYFYLVLFFTENFKMVGQFFSAEEFVCNWRSEKTPCINRLIYVYRHWLYSICGVWCTCMCMQCTVQRYHTNEMPKKFTHRKEKTNNGIGHNCGIIIIQSVFHCVARFCLPIKQFIVVGSHCTIAVSNRAMCV